MEITKSKLQSLGSDMNIFFRYGYLCYDSSLRISGTNLILWSVMLQGLIMILNYELYNSSSSQKACVPLPHFGGSTFSNKLLKCCSIRAHNISYTGRNPCHDMIVYFSTFKLSFSFTKGPGPLPYEDYWSGLLQ